VSFRQIVCWHCEHLLIRADHHGFFLLVVSSRTVVSLRIPGQVVPEPQLNSARLMYLAFPARFITMSELARVFGHASDPGQFGPLSQGTAVWCGNNGFIVFPAKIFAPSTRAMERRGAVGPISMKKRLSQSLRLLALTRSFRDKKDSRLQPLPRAEKLAMQRGSPLHLALAGRHSSSAVDAAWRSQSVISTTNESSDPSFTWRGTGAIDIRSASFSVVDDVEAR